MFNIDRFTEIFNNLPVELRAKINYQIYHIFDYETILKTQKFAPSIIPYVEINDLFLAFELNRSRYGGIRLIAEGWNDVDENGVELLQKFLNGVIQNKATINHLHIIRCSDTKRQNEVLNWLIACSLNITVQNPTPADYIYAEWWPKVSSVTFTKKKYLPETAIHENLKCIDYTGIGFKGFESWINLMEKALVEIPQDSSLKIRNTLDIGKDLNFDRLFKLQCQNFELNLTGHAKGVFQIENFLDFPVGDIDITCDLNDFLSICTFARKLKRSLDSTTDISIRQWKK
ncbi:hypothetical protein DAMA08_052410 [Martiniozyma asiatica (nom. inval.)]|nr:hypothetical protein DAMA08_052410 [Martiniozyma asiatica]